MHKWTTDKENITVTFVWIDPALTVAGSYEVKVESDTDSAYVTLHHKPAFKQPLRPGVWKLLILYNWSVVAETRFLVVPLLYYNGNEVSRDNVEFLNGGPATRYVEHNFTAIEDMLNISARQSSQLRIAQSNAKRFGADLLQWSDSLLSEFWNIDNVCTASKSYPLCHTTQLDMCHSSEWSSMSPDLKSQL